jgi:hypothetical protein
MIVLHASTHAGSLILWGESPANGSSPPAKRRAKSRPAPGLRTLPYDPGEGPLAWAVGEATGGAGPNGKEEAGQWFAWLPTCGEIPIASSPLVAEPPPNEAQASLEPWALTGLRLGEPLAADLLAGCMGQTTLAPGVVVGSTLAFWAHVFRFAGALVARQSFLPGVGREEGDQGAAFRARWEPVVAGADTQRFARLAQAMPHAARALTPHAGSRPSKTSASALSARLGAMVDHLFGQRVWSRSQPPPPGAGNASQSGRRSPAPTNSGCTPCARPMDGWKATKPTWSGSPSR